MGMNQIRLLAFAQARDALGFDEKMVLLSGGELARDIVCSFFPEAPLEQWRVALDCEYVAWDTAVNGASEMALIPPVSGG